MVFSNLVLCIDILCHELCIAIMYIDVSVLSKRIN